MDLEPQRWAARISNASCLELSIGERFVWARLLEKAWSLFQISVGRAFPSCFTIFFGENWTFDIVSQPLVAHDLSS